MRQPRHLMFVCAFVVGGCSSTGEPQDEDCPHPASFGPGAVILKGDARVEKRDDLGVVDVDLVLCELEGTSSLSGLKAVRSLWINALSSANVDLPDLETVHGDFNIRGAPRFSAPKLRRVSRFSYGTLSPQSRTVILPSLIEIDELRSFASLTEVSVLEEATTIEAYGLVAPRLRRAVVVAASATGVPVLESVDSGDFLVSASSTSSIATMPVLETAESLVFRGDAAVVSLPALTKVESLAFFNIQSLERVEVPALQGVRELWFSGNPKLSGCEIDRLVAKLNPEKITLEANGPICSD